MSGTSKFIVSEYNARAQEHADVMLDCLIERRLDDLHAIQESWKQSPTEETRRHTALIMFLARMQACHNYEHHTHGYLWREAYRYDWGKRFLKIVSKGEHQEFSQGYVEPDTGWVWKGDWKNVEKNFPRGCIYTVHSDWGTDGRAFHSIGTSSDRGLWPPDGTFSQLGLEQWERSVRFREMGGYLQRTPLGGNK